MDPEVLVNDFGSRLKVLLESVRPYVEPSEYQEVLNQATDFLATVAVAVLASHGYEGKNILEYLETHPPLISVDTDSMRVTITVGKLDGGSSTS